MLFGRAPLNIERSLFVPLRSLFFWGSLKKTRCASRGSLRLSESSTGMACQYDPDYPFMEWSVTLISCSYFAYKSRINMVYHLKQYIWIEESFNCGENRTGA